MAADFCLVAHPAETDPHEFATQRVSDRLAETGFADAGRPEKTEDSTVSLRIEFAHGEIFDQPFLNLFKIVVIAIENLLCLIEIEVILAQFVPRQIGNDLDVTDDHGKLGACWRNEIESLQSRSACFITASGGFASCSRARNCCACSSLPPSVSPSSCWIALSCERKYARRCASENCEATSFCSRCWICAISSCDEMCCCTARTRFSTAS